MARRVFPGRVLSFSRRAFAPELCHATLESRFRGHDPEKWTPVFRKDHAQSKLAGAVSCLRPSLRQVLPAVEAVTFCRRSQAKKKRKDAERRKTRLSNLRALRRGSALSGGRSPFGAPPRLLPKGLFIPRARFGPRFVRQGTKAAGLPASAKPHFQRCTSRAGLSAGGLMPEPPGNGLQFRPRAPLLLRWPGMPPDHVLHMSKAAYLGESRNIFKGRSNFFWRSCSDLTRPCTRESG